MRRSTHVPQVVQDFFAETLVSGGCGHRRASTPRGELVKMDEIQELRSRVTRPQAIVSHLMSALDTNKVMSRHVLLLECGDVRAAKEHFAQAKRLAGGS